MHRFVGDEETRTLVSPERSICVDSAPAEPASVTDGVAAGEAACVRRGEAAPGNGTRPGDDARAREASGSRHDHAWPRTDEVRRRPDHGTRAHRVPVPAGVTPGAAGPDRRTAEAVPEAEAVAVPAVARPAVHAEVRARADAPDPRRNDPAPAV